MATFLELAKDVARESGTLSPSTITSVTNLQGRPEKVVSWTRKAWTNIQNSREDWRWLEGRFSATLIPGAAQYTPASFNLTRFGSWMEDDPRFPSMAIYGPAGQPAVSPVELRQIDHYEYERRYTRGGVQSGKPTEWADAPDGILFHPVPDAAYVVRGLYYKSPQILVANDDVPEMPARFHEMIVWEAIRLMMISDGAYAESGWPQVEFARLRSELERDQLPEVTLA